jgi:hypothetical protein
MALPTCPACGCQFRPRRAGQRYCDRKCQDNYCRTMRRRSPTEFIGIDGEGVTLPNGEHRSVLLGCGAAQVENPDGLCLQDVLNFLWEQYLKAPHAAYVGFFLAYDWDMWLKHLPERKAWLLLTEGGRWARTLTKGNRSWEAAPVAMRTRPSVVRR